jgi:primosomal protein N' (replication factor Y)
VSDAREGEVLVAVGVALPIRHTLSYAVPPSLRAVAVPGAQVLVPVGNRKVRGVVVGPHEGDRPARVRAIAAAFAEDPAIPAELLAFVVQLARYYDSPLGEALKLALPPGDAAGEGRIDAPRALGSPRDEDDDAPLFARRDVPDEHDAGEGDAGDANEDAGGAASDDAPAQAGEGEALLRARDALPTRRWAVWCGGDAPTLPKSLKAQAIAVHLRAVGAIPVAELESQVPGARAALRGKALASLVRTEERELPLATFQDPVARDTPPELVDEQVAAIARMVTRLDTESPGTVLLHGVTGSGKTEVYLRLVADVRRRDRGVLVLVPEIALTPQLVSRYRARFGDDVAVVHSGLTATERKRMWKRMRDGSVRVAIGARSVLFSPVERLGLVIVDEEHDPSYKQEEGVRYQGRDMAMLRAHKAGALCVLGTATPSLETEQLARSGRIERLRMTKRATQSALPSVEVVDLRRIGAGPTGDRRLSLPLHRAIAKNLEKGEQTILFLNRRGFAPAVRCHGCGKPVECEACSIAMTFHKRAPQLRCHLCDAAQGMPERCPQCGGEELALEGTGTEKLEDLLATAFPSARVARLDRDVASGVKSAAILQRMREGEIDILVGTQMVTKGHDLPRVTLVGVIAADAALSMPDFRASERVFHLLVQVAGRAGRAELPGKVIVQAYDPDHVAIRHAAKHDVDGFLDEELQMRAECSYPPFSHLVNLRVEGRDEGKTVAAAQRIAASLAVAEVTVLGPAPAPILRIRSTYRWRVLLRSPSRAPLRSALRRLENLREELPSGVRVTVDVDPVQLL